MKKTILSLLIVVFSVSWTLSTAQVNQGGTPPSFEFLGQSKETANQKSLFEGVKTIALQKPDITTLLEEDERDAMFNHPKRVATLIPTELNLINNGTWTELPNGDKICQMNIQAKDAIAIILYYDKFYLPEGSRLFIYNAERTHILGAYTSENNPKFGTEFATEFVAGDDLILEYVPGNSTEEPVISINEVGYGYNNLEIIAANAKLPNSKFSPGASGYCMVNVNCSEGDNWQDQKKGVCHTVQRLPNGSYVCSGTILNNTSLDFTPYYMLAFHCTQDNEGNNATAANLNQWVFYFHLEYLSCESLNSAESRTLTGCRFLALNDIEQGADGYLVELNTDIPASYDAYFNGWDRRNTPLTTGVSIHHPKGDYKKISTVKTAATSDTWQSTDATGATNAHWNVFFAETENGHSVTEQGSSGSPLFNQNGLVVGTLSGGNSSCQSPNGRNLYGKLWYHWDQPADPSMHFKTRLDKGNTGAVTLEGSYKRPRDVRNLAGTYDRVNQKTTLTWDRPAGTIVTEYIIYVGGEKYDSTRSLTYTYNNPELGKTEYCVEVKAATGDFSGKQCIEVSNPLPQTISWDQAMDAVRYTTEPIDLTATASSGLTVTYASENENVAKIVDGKLVAVSLGTTTLTASQAGDLDFLAAANVTKTLNVVNGEINLIDFEIENGDVVAVLPTMEITTSFSGGYPAEYRIAEQADMTGISWKTFDSEILEHTLLNRTNELKTLYLQLKNASGESNVVNKNILYKGRYDKLDVTSFSINEGASTTSERIVNLSHKIENGIATMYSIAENPVHIGSDWRPYTSEIKYLVSSGNGQKDIYFVVANGKDTSDIAYSSILLDENAESNGLHASIHPNPAKDMINVAIEEDVNTVQVEIYSVTGQLLSTQICNGKNFNLDLSKYPSGTLLIKLTCYEQSVTKRLIKH